MFSIVGDKVFSTEYIKNDFGYNDGGVKMMKSFSLVDDSLIKNPEMKRYLQFIYFVFFVASTSHRCVLCALRRALSVVKNSGYTFTYNLRKSTNSRMHDLVNSYIHQQFNKIIFSSHFVVFINLHKRDES